MLKRSRAEYGVIWLLAAIVGNSLPTYAATISATGAKRCSAAKKSVATPQSTVASTAWQVRSTENLRFLSPSAAVDDADMTSCETLRKDICKCWLGRESACWSPKCDVVLHATEKSYLAEVGIAGRNTLASSLVKHADGRIASRRIDILATRKDWVTAAFPHELMHVVLAEAFAERTIPRWLDEGLAILADPAEKQLRHGHDLHQAFAANAQFRLVELFALADYPAPNRWGTFYGQSASVVSFLAGRDRPARLLELVKVAEDRGYEAALREVYQIDGLGDLERQWISSALKTALVAKNPAPGEIQARRTTTNASAKQPVLPTAWSTESRAASR